jgi:hypothetical protein
MRWRTIDTQLQLDALAALARWEDSHVVAGGEQRQADPPPGGERHHAHLLIQAAGSPLPLLQLVFTNYTRLLPELFTRPGLRGKVDPSGRVEIFSPSGTSLVTASRLHFRWLEETPAEGLEDWPW